MATINEITSASSYRGDANLGGGTLGVLNIDTKPVEQLAYYTLQYEQAMHKQRKQDADDKIKELAALTAINPNSVIKKDKDIMLDKYNKAIDIGQKFARLVPKNNEERIQQYLDYKKEIEDLKKLVQSGTGRSIAYEARKNSILKDPKISAEEKDYRLQKLDEEANNTDIYTPIAVEEEFDMTVPALGDANVIEFDVLMSTGDDNITETVKAFDPTTNRANALMIAQGLQGVMIDENSPEWNNLSDREKDEQRQLRMANKSGISVWVKSEGIMKEAMANPKYKTADGKIDLEAIRRDNPMLNGMFSLADEWNSYSDAKRADIDAGRFTDNIGRSGQLIQGVKSDAYFKVDYSDGLSADEIVFLALFAKHKGDKLEKKIVHHGEASQNQRNREDNAAALQRQRESDANANYRSRLSASSSGTTPATGQSFGNIIDNVNTDEVVTTTNKRITSGGKPVRMVNGTIVDANGNPVNTGKAEIIVPVGAVGDVVITEYNKATRLMKANGDEEEDTTTQSKIIPENGKLTVRIENGVVTGIKTQNGTFADRDQFGDITQKAALTGVTKQRPPTTLGQVEDDARKVEGGNKPASKNVNPSELRNKYNY